MSTFNQAESDARWAELFSQYGISVSMGSIRRIYGAISWVRVNEKEFSPLEGPPLEENSPLSLAMILLDNNTGLENVFEPELRDKIVEQLKSEL